MQIKSRKILKYTLFVFLEFTTSSINLYLTNRSNNFEKIIVGFGNLTNYFIKSFSFAVLFPLLIGFFLSLLSKKFKYFDKEVLNNAIKVLIIIITLNLLTLLFNILFPK